MIRLMGADSSAGWSIRQPGALPIANCQMPIGRLVKSQLAIGNRWDWGKGERLSCLLLRLVDKCHEPRNNLLRCFFHQPMTRAFNDDSLHIRIDQARLLNQKVS